MTWLLPPLLFLATLPPLAALWYFHPAGAEIVPMRLPVWGVPLAAGLVLLIGARLQFRNSGSEIVTFATPRNLVTGGFFRISRNPMYLGFVLVLLGAALLVNSYCALLAPAAFFAAANWWYIPHEERAARQVFGAAFDAYATRTRRWF